MKDYLRLFEAQTVQEVKTFGNVPPAEPTKPTKLGFVGFVGSSPCAFSKVFSLETGKALGSEGRNTFANALPVKPTKPTKPASLLGTQSSSDWRELYANHCKRDGWPLRPDGSCDLCAEPLHF